LYYLCLAKCKTAEKSNPLVLAVAIGSPVTAWYKGLAISITFDPFTKNITFQLHHSIRLKQI
jgi:hypothetical protein